MKQMSFLKQNNERANESKKGFGLLPDGDYEVFATEGKWEDKVGKTPNANFTFVVRSDVEQEGKGRKVFHTFYISRDPEKVETSLGFIERFNLELGVPDGVEFATQQEWINFVLGKPVKAHISKREYNGKEYNEIKWFNASDFKVIDPAVINAGKEEKKPESKGLSRVDEDPFAGNGSINITDDDLPF
jgi:hypothetical protein